MEAYKEAITAASAKYPKPADRTFQYGTAGFRMNADLLDPVMFRVGLVAALRSRRLEGKTIGVMVTASHNPPPDNGVKLVDPMGEMLEASWEKHATTVTNAPDDGLAAAVATLARETNLNANAKARVVYARDTRASGPRLIAALKAGLDALGAESTDYGLLTTPQLHYVTRCINTKGSAYEYGEPTEAGYYAKLAEAFAEATRGCKFQGPLTVDCANGVGGPKLRELIKHLPAPANGGLEVRVINDAADKPEALNHQCGADFVKTGQRAPPSAQVQKQGRYCSLDGDADRLIYYTVDEDDGFRLLDGDRIATLVAAYIGDLARAAGFRDEKLEVGVVQTAYANGAATDHVTQHLRLPCVCTATGVKHLHHAATRFDVGVYFEANGHGTAVFSDVALKRLAKHEPQSPAQRDALVTLRALTRLINQAVGDALSDLLLVETVLAQKGWRLREWDLTYKDLPNRLVRVEVRDRNIFRAVDAERRLERPEGVQAQIDALVGKYHHGRSFARASGTEDAVRVYAEAATRGEADDLANKVVAVIKQAGA